MSTPVILPFGLPLDSLRQAFLFRATKTVDAHAARAPAPRYLGGGSGLSYHVFRGAMIGRCLASGGVRLRRQSTVREGRGGGGGGEGGRDVSWVRRG